MTWPKTTTAATAAVAAAPNPTRTNILLARGVALAVGAALLASALFAVGCKNGGGSSSGGSAGGVAGARGDSTNMGTLVKSGASPMNYRLGSAGTLRIVDTTANDTVLLTAPITAGTNVTINDVKGISINGSVVKPGPLPARHRYALWLDTRQPQ